MIKQRAQTTKAHKSSPYTYASSPWTSANTGHKPVRPITYRRTHPQKPKMQKKCTSSPLTVGIGYRDAMHLFSTFLSPPCCQCMNQGSNLKKCNPELFKYTKFITRCYTCPNEQVRYSTCRNDLNYKITKFHNHWTRLTRIWVILRKVTLSWAKT
jgi:hypothetical protein